MLGNRVQVAKTARADTQDRWGQGRGGRPWRRTRERVFRRDKYLCQICLAKGRITPVELHGNRAGICDHITPLSQGGAEDAGNLQTICNACDAIKTSMESDVTKKGTL